MPHTKKPFDVKDGQVVDYPYEKGCKIAVQKIDPEHRVILIDCHADANEKVTLGLVDIDRKTGKDSTSLEHALHSPNLEINIAMDLQSLQYQNKALNVEAAGKDIADAVHRIFENGNLGKKAALKLEAIRAEASALFPTKNNKSDTGALPEDAEIVLSGMAKLIAKSKISSGR